MVDNIWQELKVDTESFFTMERETGELGKGLSKMKDKISIAEKNDYEKDEKIKSLEEKLVVAENKIVKLVEVNGEMLMKTPVKYEQPTMTNPYEKQEEEVSGIEQLLGGIKI